jgi:hypothetical protein
MSRRSHSKQRGALMSSRLMAPKIGAIRVTVSTISSTSLVSRQIGNASISANLAKEHAFAFYHRRRAEGSDITQPEHGRDDRDAVAFDRQLIGFGGISGNRHRDPRDAGRVYDRKIRARLDGHLAFDPNLAAQMRQKRCIRNIYDAKLRQPFDRGAHGVADRFRRNGGRNIGARFCLVRAGTRSMLRC